MSDFFIQVPARAKFAGDAKPFTIDAKARLRTFWRAGRRYNANDTVRSFSVPGFAYQAGGAGESGPAEPPWPRVLNGTMNDGSITWTAITPGSNATDPIVSAAWSQVNPPDGVLTIGAPTNTVEESTAVISGGTSGSTYRVQCAITTTAGNVYVVQFDVEIN